jgi:hypothetical protein
MSGVGITMRTNDQIRAYYECYNTNSPAHVLLVRRAGSPADDDQEIFRVDSPAKAARRILDFFDLSVLTSGS